MQPIKYRTIMSHSRCYQMVNVGLQNFHFLSCVIGIITGIFNVEFISIDTLLSMRYLTWYEVASYALVGRDFY